MPNLDPVGPITPALGRAVWTAAYVSAHPPIAWPSRVDRRAWLEYVHHAFDRACEESGYGLEEKLRLWLASSAPTGRELDGIFVEPTG